MTNDTQPSWAVEDISVELDNLIGIHGLHNVTVALLDLITHKVEVCAAPHYDVALAKKWNACIDAARALERVALRHFGDAA